MCSERVGQLPAEERRGSDHEVGSANPQQDEIPQAASH
jgi:hypothetical protein